MGTIPSPPPPLDPRWDWIDVTCLEDDARHYIRGLRIDGEVEFGDSTDPDWLEIEKWRAKRLDLEAARLLRDNRIGIALMLGTLLSALAAIGQFL